MQAFNDFEFPDIDRKKYFNTLKLKRTGLVFWAVVSAIIAQI